MAPTPTAHRPTPVLSVALPSSIRASSDASTHTNGSDDSTACRAVLLIPTDSRAEGAACRHLAGPRPLERQASAADSIASASSAASSAQSSRQPSCSIEAAADQTQLAQAQAEQAAAAAAARATLACVLAPMLPARLRASLAAVPMARIVQLIEDVADDAADGRALLELLCTAAKAVRLSADLRAATMPAAVAILGAAALRIKPSYAARLAPERRVSRAVARMLHDIGEGVWWWAPRLRGGADTPAVTAVKDQGRRYLRSLWTYQFSDLPGCSWQA